MNNMRLVIGVLFWFLISTGAYSQCIPGNEVQAVAGVIDASCNSGSDGEIILSVTGGVPPYSFNWSNGSATQNLEDLEAGSYDVTVTDADSCVDVLSNITVSEPGPFIYNVILTNTSCYGSCDGALDFFLTGGTPPYEYLWTNALTGDTLGTSEDLDSLCAGFYGLSIKDDNGCTGGIFYFISEPDSITMTSQVNDVTCPGGNDGSILLQVSGGTGQKSFLWSNGANSKNLFNLTAGTYTVTATDLNGCTAVKSITVDEPDSIDIDNSNITDVSCNGADDGMIELIPAGGTPPYSYAWDTGDTSSVLTGLAPGEYCVVITDAKGCISDTLCLEIEEPDPLQVNGTRTPVTCKGGSDGAIDITVTGGTAPYTYFWSNGAMTQDVNGLPEGIYTVMVTDAHGCTEQATFTITTLSNHVINFGVSNATCGKSNGSITVTVNGGSPPFTFLWNTGDATDFIDGLAAGVYSVTIIDINGCVDSASTVVDNISDMDLSFTKTDVICGGGNTGSIDLSVTGGVGPYTYSWSSGQMTQDISGLGAGIYNVTVTDSLGCMSSLTITIQEGSGLTLTVTNNPSNCGMDDGSASVSVTGGTPPYAYLWSTGSTDNSIDSLAQGLYLVTVTDANGCTASDFAVIDDIDGPSVTINKQDVTCLEGGSIEAIATGGQPPYAYIWSTGEITSTIDGLSAGTYSVTVSDSVGCSTTEVVDIVEPDSMIVIAEKQDPTCHDGEDGSVDVTVIGGTSPYSYLWSTGDTTEDLSGLSAGSYSLTVTDAGGCIAVVNVTIENPEPIIAVADTIIQPTCPGDSNGAIQISVTGGTPPYEFDWSNGDTTMNLSNLPAGQYCVVVTDSNACVSDTFCFQVIDPQEIQITPNITQPLCNGDANGSISVTVSGGTPPYSYLWGTGDTTPTLTGIPAGDYPITVTDDHGCTATDTLTVDEPDTLQVSVDDVTDVLCGNTQDGAITISVSGGTPPYDFLWSTGDTTQNLTGLGQGDYQVTVTDANGCMDTSDIITIIESDTISISGLVQDVMCPGDSNGSIIVTVTGGTPPYNYLWNTGDTTKDLFMIPGGTYTVSVTDSLGCDGSQSFTVIDPPVDDIRIDTVIPLLCNQDTIGVICAIVDGSPPPFTYLWSTGDTTRCLYNIPAGVYSVTVTDDNGCLSYYNNFTFTEPDPIEFNANITPVGCEGGMDGAIDLTPTGGTPPYSIIWSTGDSTEDLTGLSPGLYTVSITDSSACMNEASFTIETESVLVLNLGVTNATCTESDGSVTVTANGGTAPYTYQWSTGETNPTISGKPAGAYEVTVTDANGCTASVIAIINNTVDMEITANTTNTVCGSGSTGAIDITVTGGSSPYSYLWSNGETTQDISGLPAGDYYVIVTDADSCKTGLLVTIEEESGLTLTANVTDATCGQADGMAVVAAAGGASPYSYFWSDLQSTNIAVGLSAGVYQVTVEDINGCSASLAVVVNDVGGPEFTVSTEDLSCQNGNDGSASVSIVNGTGPFVYEWSTSDNTGSVSGLGVGLFSVTVIDSSGCSSSETFNIEAAEGIIAEADKTEPSCPGEDDGSIELTVSGGLPPYDYQWSTSAMTKDIFNLEAGLYSVIVTDSNGCWATTNILLDEPPPIIAMADSIINTNCFNDPEGSIDISVTGGEPPYSFLWSTGDSTEDIIGVPGGTYCVTVTDANGCESDPFCFTVDQPDEITITPDITGIICHGDSNGSISINVMGGMPPYVFDWSNGGTGNFIGGLAAGDYTVTVTDSAGCEQIRTFTVPDIDPITFDNSIVTSPTCDTTFDGSIVVVVSGGTPPYSYFWDDSTTGPTRDSLGNGTYCVTVFDAHECLGATCFDLEGPKCNNPPIARDDTVSFYVCSGMSVDIPVLDNDEDPDGDNLFLDGIFGGPSNGSAVLNSDQTITYTADEEFVGLDTFQYTVCDDGILPQLCDDAMVIIAVLPCRPNIFIPDGFSPNGDDVNDIFVIEGIEEFPDNRLLIFNRWGNQVRKFEGYANEWKGKNSDGEPLPDGTYYYILELGDEAQTVYTGYVIIHR